MASLLQKLLKNQSAARIITTLNKPQPRNFTPPFLTYLHHQTHLTESKSHNPNSINLTPFLGPLKTEESTLQVYPSFSFGIFLNPSSFTDFVQSEAEDVISGDSQTIWADSVKKKRKRKMNKHKYKKLRKRFRP